MALMFTATPAIKRAVTLINNLGSSKFPLLLTRILQKLHLKDERTFSEDEEEKLQGSLELTGPDLELVLQSLEFFLQQAAYHTAKPGVFSQQLKQIELEEEKVQVIVEAWTNSAKDVITKLRQRTIVPKQLESVNWRLNLQMAQSNKAKMKMPNAMFEFNVTDENTTEKEKIKIEFTHDELYMFYNQLETIQKQLDCLS
ncbi:COMM domain-containing protein 10-like [Mytilus californianus]|uniref:COMM domain-containing protein 10-like n=1 Tax=Mytilus californianus TaxID=6549 RepID=UPI0022480FB9|nr:COMM domain-containing protein 10-like [Mytilus californianus]